MAFSISVSKKLAKTGFRNILIEAIKAANPSLNDLNFDDFKFELNSGDISAPAIKSHISSGVSGYQEGMTVKPTVKMIIKDNEDVKRNYTTKSYETTFLLNSPNVDEFIKKHITTENLSELTWDNYSTVLTELKKFINNSYDNSSDPIVIKEESENADSKHIHLCFNTTHIAGNEYDDTPYALLSYRYVSDEIADGYLKRVLSFHFTRAEVENKRDLTIDNNTLTVGENGMTENV